MQDVKTSKNRLEAFSFWCNKWQADLIPMLSSSKKIPVSYVIPIKDESETTVFDKTYDYIGGVYKVNLPKRVINLHARLEA